jgi:hypothetical protein
MIRRFFSYFFGFFLGAAIGSLIAPVFALIGGSIVVTMVKLIPVTSGDESNNNDPYISSGGKCGLSDLDNDITLRDDDLLLTNDLFSDDLFHDDNWSKREPFSDNIDTDGNAFGTGDDMNMGVEDDF